MCLLLRALLVDLRGAGGIYTGEWEDVWISKREGLSADQGRTTRLEGRDQIVYICLRGDLLSSTDLMLLPEI